MFKGLGGLGDMAKMMKQAKEMQGKVSEVQDGLSKILVNGESGAGLVKVTMTAKGDITNLDIDPSIFSPTEKEVVEDLIIAALKDAKKKSLDRTQKEMAKITNELGLPENFKLPF
jgi:hypothetical protein|tara:strand:- start:133 stop:477 length:345 start_codon:yes stop_codon:yes gene_type:complete